MRASIFFQDGDSETHLRVEGKASLEKEEFKIQKNSGSIMKGPSPKVAEERGDKIDAQVREGSSERRATPLQGQLYFAENPY